MVRLLAGDVDPLGSGYSQTLPHQQVGHVAGPGGLKHLPDRVPVMQIQNFSLHYCPPEREVGEGGHGADGEVVEQLAPDLLADLPARLARQTVAREQGAQLLHLLVGTLYVA